MWEAPQITPRQVSRAAYGFDIRGQLVSDVSGQALRAIHEAMLLTLQDNLPPPHSEPLQQATKAWLSALNRTIPGEAPFNEAWIKGTMHSYSTEFFFLADYYARHISGDEQAYMRHLVRMILPAPLRDLGTTVSLNQLIKGHKVVFQHAAPMELRVIRSGLNSAVVQWHPTSLLARVGPQYREELMQMIQAFARMMFSQLPVVIKGLPPAQVSESALGADITEWRIRWSLRTETPKMALAGAVGTLLCVVGAAAGLTFLGYLALIPLLIGAGVEVYRYVGGRIVEQEKALLDQVEYNHLQSLELNAAYTSLRSSSAAHEQQAQDLLAVRDAVLALSTSFDQDRVMDGLIELMTEVLRFDRTLILIRERSENVLTFGTISHPPDDPQDKLRLNLLRIALDDDKGFKSDDPLLIPWIKGTSLMVHEPSTYYNSQINWLLALLEFNTFYSVPLMLADEMLGVLLVDNRFTHLAISPQSRSLVDSLATMIAMTLENARLYHNQDEQLRQNLEEMQLMEQLDRELANTLDLDIVLELLMDWALRFTGAQLAIILLVDEAARVCQIAAYYGCEESDLPGGQLNYEIPLEDGGISGQAALDREIKVINEVTQQPNYIRVIEGMAAQVSVPILRQGRVVAVMSIESGLPQGFTPEHVNFVERLATRVGVFLENSRLYTSTLQEREKLSAVLANTKDAVIVIDEGGDLILINRAAVEVFKLERSPTEYTERSFVSVFGGTDLEFVYNSVVSGEEIGSDVEVEFETNTYSVSAARVPTIGYTILLHDVTVFKEVDRLKSELISTVSHDLKNPLAVMKGYIDMMEMTQQLTPKGKHYVSRIKMSVENMRQLIDDLLDLARIESGLTLELGRIDLAIVIHEVNDELGQRAEAKSITIETELPRDLPLVTGEYRRVKQIVANLVSNAIKYTLVNGRVTVSAQEDGEFVRVLITDSGVGIEPENIDRVWQRFERLRNDKTADEEGTGLGLAIVRNLVEIHGGEIGLESQLDVGSTFWFTMPLSENDHH